MRRRTIPFALALLVLLVGLAPLKIGAINAEQADIWTLILASFVFAFKSGLFAWMRYRMVTDTRRLTVFGLALVDFFTALTVMAIVLAAVFMVTFVYAYQGTTPLSIGLRTLNRACIVSAGVLVIATGTAAAFEMRRAGIKLSVHEDRSS